MLFRQQLQIEQQQQQIAQLQQQQQLSSLSAASVALAAEYLGQTKSDVVASLPEGFESERQR